MKRQKKKEINEVLHFQVANHLIFAYLATRIKINVLTRFRLYFQVYFCLNEHFAKGLSILFSTSVTV